jgi:hypothetical protein
MAQNTPRPRTSPTDGCFGLDLVQLGADDVGAQHAGVLDDALLLEDVDGGRGRRAGERVARVGEPAGDRGVGERVGDAPADDHAAERHVARVHALGEADEVGRDVPVLHGEPLAAPTEAGHHLVGDDHDAVAVADLTHAGEVAGRRHEDAVGAHHRLEDDGGHRLRPLDHERVLEVLQRALALLGLVVAWKAERYGYGPQNFTTPGMLGSLPQRRGSPVSAMAPAVAPW